MSCILSKTAAQQNWAAVPCFSLNFGDPIGRILNNEAQNEIILCTGQSYKVCNSTYKGFFAFNGNSFHDMDFGIEAQNPNPYVGYGAILNDCIEYNGKALITGGFSTVGSDTLYSRCIATWNGMAWDTFPHPLWTNKPTYNVGFSKLLKDNNKLWMFAGWDSTGNNPKYRPVLYDGSTFNLIPAIPVNNPSSITEAIMYKNKLVVSGNFDDYPTGNYDRLAQFDGTSWSPLGNGLRGGLSACQTVAIYKDTLYIGGAFSKGAGNAGNYLMKWDGSQLLDAGFSDTFCGYGAIWKLLPYRDRLYAFGGINCAAGQKAHGVAYYENGKWTVPNDSIDNSAIFDAVVYKDAIYIGGDFESINGDSSLHKFVKLACPDFDAAAGCISGLNENYFSLEVNVFPNPSKGKIKIEFEQNISIDKISITNTLGQQVYTLLTPEPKQEIDVSQLSPGIYFLKAESKHGQGIFKVVKE